MLPPNERAFETGFEVLAEATVAIEPSESALDHPAPRQDHEAGRAVAAADDLDLPAADPVEGALQLGAAVAAVGKDVTEPGIEIAGGSQDQRRAVAIVDVRLMNHRRDRQAESISEQVALAPRDLLAGVIPTRTAGLSRLDGLAVEDPGTGASIALARFAEPHQQTVADCLPQPIAPPTVEEPLHRREWRKLLGQLTPLAARRQHVIIALTTSRSSVVRGRPNRLPVAARPQSTPIPCR
jgi:hypothetical protein